MSQKIRPTGIQVDRRQRQVFINWNDGTTCAYPFDGLRAVCPCVSCRGGHAYMGGPPDPNVVRLTPATDLTITNVVAVGGYALQIQWSDGHEAGIYTWDFLLQACPERAG